MRSALPIQVTRLSLRIAQEQPLPKRSRSRHLLRAVGERLKVLDQNLGMPGTSRDPDRAQRGRQREPAPAGGLDRAAPHPARSDRRGNNPTRRTDGATPAKRDSRACRRRSGPRAACVPRLFALLLEPSSRCTTRCTTSAGSRFDSEQLRSTQNIAFSSVNAGKLQPPENPAAPICGPGGRGSSPLAHPFGERGEVAIARGFDDP